MRTLRPHVPLVPGRTEAGRMTECSTPPWYHETTLERPQHYGDGSQPSLGRDAGAALGLSILVLAPRLRPPQSQSDELAAALDRSANRLGQPVTRLARRVSLAKVRDARTEGFMSRL